MSDLFEKELEAAEVFAYELMIHGHGENQEIIAEREALWKDESDAGLLFRKNERARAKKLLERISTAGLRIAKSSSSKVSKRLREIQLIPERQAYTLEDELKQPSDAPQLPG